MVGDGEGGESGVSNMEHETVRQERDMAREELAQVKLTVDNLRQELQVFPSLSLVYTHVIHSYTHTHRLFLWINWHIAL